MKCEHCNKEIPDDEFIVNWGWCNTCFDDNYTLYMESVAGPFDYLLIGRG